MDVVSGLTRQQKDLSKWTQVCRLVVCHYEYQVSQL